MDQPPSLPRPLIIGEAPLTAGAPPSPGTYTRWALEELFGGLVTEVDLANALEAPQPAGDWGRAFDAGAARERLIALFRSGAFDGRDTILASARLAQAARWAGLPLPWTAATWADLPGGGRLAWIHHPSRPRHHRAYAPALAALRRDLRGTGTNAPVQVRAA